MTTASLSRNGTGTLPHFVADPESLPAPVNGTARRIETTDGTVMAYEAGSGPTVILVHSFNAAGSAVEMRPLFDRLAKTRHVIAFDWIGFGTSDRPDIDYTPHGYQRQLREVLDALTADPVDVIALSLPAQYVVLQAAGEGQRFRRLALISPTGFGRFRRNTGGIGRVIANLLRRTPIGDALFGLLRTKPSIRYFNRQLFAYPDDIPGGFMWYEWRSSQEPGAKWAPIAFVSGLLNDERSPAAYERVAVPTLMLFGSRARFTDPQAGRALAATNPHLQVIGFEDCGDLPQIEMADATARVIDRFLAGESKPVAEKKPRRTTKAS